MVVTVKHCKNITKVDTIHQTIELQGKTGPGREISEKVKFTTCQIATSIYNTRMPSKIPPVIDASPTNIASQDELGKEKFRGPQVQNFEREIKSFMWEIPSLITPGLMIMAK